ncbi:peptidylprolyl isomerase [Labedaea rhizosphaerae]|uniref:Peptidyl-prolyl cis-trans isomerase n=1 Tax=Labedaea rhizosphaerae TaxID=598644 RepID=A0A4R6SK20_LABRH|nr:peptidylprolyl isomerase [Labedaea rhizosphaerae]TDQ01299.1 peptidyl-prolyl cis-trans isomerase B (cyclophilin B) [Labedaea rhizosphaerae]
MPTNQQRRAAAKRKLERQLVNRAERARKRRNLGVIITVAGVIVVVGGIYLLVNLSSGDDTAAPASTPPSSSAAPQPDKPATIPTKLAAEPKRPSPLPATVSCEYKQDQGAGAAKPATAPNGKNVSATGKTSATMATTIGDIKMTLNRALAPCAVNSFLSLAKQGYFDNTPCHRMTTGAGLQVLQCGDPTGQGTGGPGYSFKDETFKQLKYGPGILAMANSGPNTNGSQFFIVYGDGSGLKPNYTVFGTIDQASIQRIDDVAKAGVNPTNGPGDGAPVTPVNITGVTVAN